MLSYDAPLMANICNFLKKTAMIAVCFCQKVGEIDHCQIDVVLATKQSSIHLLYLLVGAFPDV